MVHQWDPPRMAAPPDELRNTHLWVPPGKIFQQIPSVTWASIPSKSLIQGSNVHQDGEPLVWREKSQELKDCFHEMPGENLGISIATLGPRKQTPAQNGERHILPMSLVEHCHRRV